MDVDPKNALSSGSRSLESLLRHIGISLPTLPETDPAGKMRDLLIEKKKSMLEVLENLQSVADSPLATYLESADNASQLLSSALYADSNFEVSLPDSGQERKLALLEDQIGLVQKAIEGINLDILYQGDRAQERFMERWM